MSITLDAIENLTNTTFDQYGQVLNKSEEIQIIFKKIYSLGIYYIITENTDCYLDYIISFLENNNTNTAKMISDIIKIDKNLTFDYDKYFEKNPDKEQYRYFFN